MIQEKSKTTLPGLFMIFVLLVSQLAALGVVIVGAAMESAPVALFGVLLTALTFFLWFGLFTVQPNQARVLQLFGSYVGSVRKQGLRWANPFFTKKRVSLRIRNFESDKLKVNDKGGSPVEIAAIVVWRVVDSAEAVFEVDDYEEFVHIQSEAALRNMTTAYPYDQLGGEDEISLRSHSAEIADKLREEIDERLDKAGVEVIEARISHLAYSPEIAGAMLQRQQADAIIAARQKIVEGAVGMVEMALIDLSEKNVVELDDEQKASMVSNLLVVLCSDQGTQPIVNAGSTC